MVLGPGINIKRSPLCGRNFEYVSEDPHLAGRVAAGLVEGLQGEGVGACVKHFAANNQETDRLRVNAEVDERTLREIYLPAFEHVITTARPWTVMCAYNKVNGTYASQHRWLLTEVLREEWGFDGLVMSDWGAVADRVPALAAGLDLEMPPHLGVSDRAIVEAVADGTLPEEVLDTAVARVLRLVERARARTAADMADPAHHALARRAAAACMVLLRNDGVLPLASTGRIAVVGAFATTPRYQGAGSSQVNPTRVDSPLDELVAALPDAKVDYAAGFGIDDPSEDAALAEEAVRVAAGADVVVAYLGLPAIAESEGFDRTHIDLPTAQTDLLARLGGAGAPVVVVLANGSAVRTAPWEQHAAAVLECWLGGQAVGGAIADVLTGAADPGGRLAETIPLRLEDTPSYLNFPGEEGLVRYGEGVFVGYRGFDAAGREVAYPFGHGLSYTTFAYDDLAVRVSGTDVTVEVTVSNTGGRAGREVAQLYVGDPEAAVARPPRELKGFAAVELGPGEQRRITFDLARPGSVLLVEHRARAGCWRAASSRSRSAHPRATSGNRPRSPSAHRGHARRSPPGPAWTSGSPTPTVPRGCGRLRARRPSSATPSCGGLSATSPSGGSRRSPRWGSPTTCCGGSAWRDAQPLTRSTRDVQLRDRTARPLVDLPVASCNARSLNDDSPERDRPASGGHGASKETEP